MPERRVRPIDVRCPSCGAEAGKECFGRPGLMHKAREDAVKEYEAELRRLDEWNRACRT